MRVFCLYFVLLVSASAWADKVDDLTRRIEELEAQQAELLEQVTEQKGEVTTFLNDHVSFGGFYEHANTGISGPDTKTQVANTANFLGLNIGADFNQDWKFVSQSLIVLSIGLFNEHNDPRATAFGFPSRREFGSIVFGAIPTQNYVEYGGSEGFRVQAGMGYAPFGFTFQQRELVLFIRRGGPLLLRTSGLVNPLWTGAHIYGSFPVSGEKGRWGYDVYSFTLSNSLKVPGGGVRTWWSSPNEMMIFGVSAQIGKRGEYTYEVVGGDLRVKYGRWQLTTEYGRQFIEGDDAWSVYLEPSVSILNEQVILYVFADHANSTFSQTGSGSRAFSDPFRKWEYGGGINWLPTAYTRFRLGITENDYVGDTASIAGQNRDYTTYDLSFGVAF